MSSRMDKYDVDTPELKKRTERNKDLYRSYDALNYDKFDVNSNVSVLKTDARNIDVDQIRDMLDKKYRDNIPKRKSIAIDLNDTPTSIEEEDTKEYDINTILSKAKEAKRVDYEIDRLNKVDNNQLELINEVNDKYKTIGDDQNQKELMDLINTITALEMKNNNSKDADLLNLSETTTIEKTKTESIVPEEFYTGELAVSEEDFDDFKDMEKDIKSNTIIIKILIFIFIIIAIGIIVVLTNKYLNLGLF